MPSDTPTPESTVPSAREWLERFADQLGVDAPDDVTVETLLDIAGVAAHASERVAAPIACYLIGRAAADPTAVLASLRP